MYQKSFLQVKGNGLVRTWFDKSLKFITLILDLITTLMRQFWQFVVQDSIDWVRFLRFNISPLKYFPRWTLFLHTLFLVMSILLIFLNSSLFLFLVE
jgi:hypothetical protein